MDLESIEKEIAKLNLNQLEYLDHVIQVYYLPIAFDKSYNKPKEVPDVDGDETVRVDEEHPESD